MSGWKKNIFANPLRVGQIFMWIIGVILFPFSYIQTDFQGMFLAILIVFFSNLWFALSKFENRMAYTLFLASFFCFMLGRMSMEFFQMGFVNYYFSENITDRKSVV